MCIRWFSRRCDILPSLSEGASIFSFLLLPSRESVLVEALRGCSSINFVLPLIQRNILTLDNYGHYHTSFIKESFSPVTWSDWFCIGHIYAEPQSGNLWYEISLWLYIFSLKMTESAIHGEGTLPIPSSIPMVAVCIPTLADGDLDRNDVKY